jgi:hypothetical protein
MDFAKAIDKVPHQRLLYKLHHYGISGPTLIWVKSFLTSRKQHVLTKEAISPEAEVYTGVSQGTVMGPLLFLAFINGLPDAVSSPVKLFADDCLIFRNIESANDTTILQQDLTALESWERDWKMLFHPEKCTTIHITRKKRPKWITPFTATPLNVFQEAST